MRRDVAVLLAGEQIGLDVQKLALIAGGPVGRHRLRPADYRQQFRLRPDPLVGAQHPGRRLGRGGERPGIRARHQRPRDRDRDLRPRDPDRAERESRHRRGQELGPQRPGRAHHHPDQRRLRERRRTGARHADRRGQGAGPGARFPPRRCCSPNSPTGRSSSISSASSTTSSSASGPGATSISTSCAACGRRASASPIRRRCRTPPTK